VPALPLGDQLHVHVALLRHPDNGHGGLDAIEDAFGDDQPFVDDCLCLHASRRQRLGDDPGSFISADLFVVTEGEVDGPLGNESLMQELLGRLQSAQDIDLVVQGPAAVDETVGDVPGEGWVAPLLSGCRHDIHVSCQNQGR
jgi:hypothetical protein